MKERRLMKSFTHSRSGKMKKQLHFAGDSRLDLRALSLNCLLF